MVSSCNWGSLAVAVLICSGVIAAGRTPPIISFACASINSASLCTVPSARWSLAFRVCVWTNNRSGYLPSSSSPWTVDLFYRLNWFVWFRLANKCETSFVACCSSFYIFLYVVFVVHNIGIPQRLICSVMVDP